jgi:ribosomal protein S18 acetylase RimI-like enzyme
MIRQLNLDMDVQVRSFQKQWESAQVQLITLDGKDVGWLQSMTADDSLFLAQLFVDAPVQRRGIGTEVMRRVIGEASRAGRAVELAVVKINPALRLYQRLGFQVTHEDDRKFYMRREPDAAPIPGM